MFTSGTKDKCIQHWNRQAFTSISKKSVFLIEVNVLFFISGNRDAEFDEEDDNVPDSMPQTLQMPTHTFLTRKYFFKDKKLL